jgi:hypothetical protein
MFAKIKYWFQNYWDYYKWPVILIAFFAAVIIFCIAQSSTKEDTDVNILFVGPHVFSVGEKDILENNLSQVLGEDYDEDGKKKADVIDMPAFSDAEIREAVGTSDDIGLMIQYGPYTYDEVEKHFSQQVFAGDAVICFVAPHWYNILKSNNGLTALEDVLGYRPEGIIDDYGVKLSDLPIGEFCNLPEDTIVCFRRPSTATALTGRDEAQRRYDISVEVMKDLFAFR